MRRNSDFGNNSADYMQLLSVLGVSSSG